VLEQLGVLDKISKVSGSLNYMNRISNTGEPLGSLDINELNRLMKYPSYSIIRKDLMSILIQRTVALNIDIHYQHEVINLSNNNAITTVKFSNGKSIQPDIIIGADGRMKSFARQYVHGSNSPIYQGFINWVGVFEQDSADFSDLSVSDYWGVGERFGIVPISKTKAYWAGGIVSKHINEIQPNKYKAELNAIFSEWPDIISKIINETPLSQMNKIHVHDHDPIDTWHKGNVVLLGDAAHSPLPTSGQGACQALEDAWHLAQCLNNNVKDLSKAFTLFTELRLSKTSGITMGGRQLASSIFNQDVEFCKHRNLASKNTNYRNAVVGMAKGWSSGLPISV
jgi:FAD-dependent urate hydroxylase